MRTSVSELHKRLKIAINEIEDDELKTIITNYSLRKCDYVIVNSLNYDTVTEVNNVCDCIVLSLKTILAASITNDREKLNRIWELVPISFEDAIKTVRDLSHMILEANDKKKEKQKEKSNG